MLQKIVSKPGLMMLVWTLVAQPPIALAAWHDICLDLYVQTAAVVSLCDGRSLASDDAQKFAMLVNQEAGLPLSAISASAKIIETRAAFATIDCEAADTRVHRSSSKKCAPRFATPTAPVSAGAADEKEIAGN